MKKVERKMVKESKKERKINQEEDEKVRKKKYISIGR